MLRYLTKRVIMALVIIYIVVTMSFFMIRLMPGNPMSALESQLRVQGGLTDQEIQQRVAAVYGVVPTDPVLTQYKNYLLNLLHGNLGVPITNPGTTVMAVIAQALPWTILIVGVALIVSFIIGIAIGSAMASFPDSAFSKIMTFVVSFLSAVPNYLIAILLIYVLTATYRAFPTGGAYGVDVAVGLNGSYILSVLYHAVLPIVASVITSFGGWALAMKGSAVSVLGSEYVRAAESRGLSDQVISRSYVGRNSMLPLVTQLALSIGFMFGGSFFIEYYFQYPGIGYYLVQSINNRDYSLMMGCFLLITVSVVVTNLLVDLLYPLVDPRIINPAARKRADTMGPDAGSDDIQALPVGGTVA